MDMFQWKSAGYRGAKRIVRTGGYKREHHRPICDRLDDDKVASTDNLINLPARLAKWGTMLQK